MLRVLGPGDLLDPHVRHPCHQVGRLRLDGVDHVDRPGGQGVLARRRIEDHQVLDLVEMCPIGLEVVGIALEEGPHARIERVDDVGAGPVAAGDVDVAVPVGGHDDEPVVAEHEGEVRVGRLQPDHDLVVAVLAHLLDGLEQRPDRRRAVLAAVPVDRVDHVLRRQGLAVVEGDPLAQSEHPGPALVAGLDALRKLRANRAVRLNFGQVVAPAPVVAELHHRTGALQRIQGLRGRPRGEALAQPPALLRRRRQHRIGHRECARQGNARRHRSGDELAAIDRAARKLPPQVGELS